MEKMWSGSCAGSYRADLSDDVITKSAPFSMPLGFMCKTVFSSLVTDKVRF